MRRTVGEDAPPLTTAGLPVETRLGACVGAGLAFDRLGAEVLDGGGLDVFLGVLTVGADTLGTATCVLGTCTLPGSTGRGSALLRLAFLGCALALAWAALESFLAVASRGPVETAIRNAATTAPAIRGARPGGGT